MIPEKEQKLDQTLIAATKKKEDEDRGGAAAMFGSHSALNEASPVGRRSRGGAFSLDRLWNLKPNELTMILAGLGVLLVAPLIEYVLSRSPDQAATRSEFDNPGAFLPEQENMNEAGIMRMAAGGLMGQSNPVVKRLDVPDLTKYIEVGDMDVAKVNPSLLEAPASGSKRKEKAESSSTNWEEALTMAARGSVSQATHSVSLPRPSSRMVGKLSTALSGFQGLTNLSNGSSASRSFTLAPPSSQGLTGTPQRSESLTRVQALPEFHGGRMRGPASPGATGAGFFNSAPNLFGRPGGGVTVETVSTPGPGTGAAQSPGGRPSEGDLSKSPALGSSKDSKSLQPVKSLSQEMAEYNAKKGADLNFDIQKYYAIDRPKMILQQELQTAGQLLNTTIQGIFDLVKANIQKNQQQNQQNQQQQRQPPQQQNQQQAVADQLRADLTQLQGIQFQMRQALTSITLTKSQIQQALAQGTITAEQATALNQRLDELTQLLATINPNDQNASAQLQALQQQIQQMQGGLRQQVGTPTHDSADPAG